MNPILFWLLFILAWIVIYAVVRYFFINEWLNPYSLNHRGSPLWLVSGIIVSILAIWGSIELISEVFFTPMPEEMRSGVIQERQYDPPYTSHSFIMVNKVFVPTTHNHEAKYWLLIKGKSQSGNDLTDWVAVGQDTYESFSVADSIYFKPTVQP